MNGVVPVGAGDRTRNADGYVHQRSADLVKKTELSPARVCEIRVREISLVQGKMMFEKQSRGGASCKT